MWGMAPGLPHGNYITLSIRWKNFIPSSVSDMNTWQSLEIFHVKGVRACPLRQGKPQKAPWGWQASYCFVCPWGILEIISTLWNWVRCSKMSSVGISILKLLKTLWREDRAGYIKIPSWFPVFTAKMDKPMRVNGQMNEWGPILPTIIWISLENIKRNKTLKTDSLIVDFQASRFVEKEVRDQGSLELFSPRRLFVHELVLHGFGGCGGGKFWVLSFFFKRMYQEKIVWI